MDKKIVRALIGGIAVYVLVIILAYIQRDLSGPQLLLMLVAPFVTGFLATGVKKGLILGFLISFVMLIVEALILMPGAFSDPNVVMAILLMSALPFALISIPLGATGGLLGRRVFKK